MLKPGDRHLTEEELDALADLKASGQPSLAKSSTPTESVVQHLSECQDCQQQLDKRVVANGSLGTIKNWPATEPGPLCATAEEWMRIAAGLVAESVAQKMLDHAAECDHCGPLLRRTAEDFADSISPEESKLVANLGSSSPRWQSQMATRLRDSANTREQKFRFLGEHLPWRWAALAFAGLTLAAILTWVFLPRPDQRVQRLIAQAYTDRRNMELRLPYAQHAPIRIERGQQTSHLDSPSALLDAESLINKNLAEHPSDPFWLQSRARAELLEGNYTEAIDILQQALAAKAVSASVLTDLATAYSQRAEATDHPEDFGRAIELLGQALNLSPNDPVALFNRAVISGKIFLYTQAIEDWENYLRMDPTGKWADEARSRMENAKKEQEQRKHADIMPLFTPAQLARVNLDDSSIVEAIDEQFESYAKAAIAEWLTVAYPVVPTESAEAAAARGALSKIAEIALVRHSDHWWIDLLRGGSLPNFPQALKSLSATATANESADTVTAEGEAERAIQLFGTSGQNEAGILRAREEALYASNLEQDGKKCLRMVDLIEKNLRQHSYHWLAIETQIQVGNCLWLQENLGGARTLYSTAAADAAGFGYKTIQLGAQDHLSMASGAAGDYATGWRTALNGLDHFWRGRFPDVRGYNFYYSLVEMARLEHEPFLERAIWKDGIRLTESSPDLAQRATAHSMMANVALATNDPSTALREFDRASQLFARSPQIESTRLARFETETRLAGAEALLGHNESAISRLRSIEADITQLSDNYLKVLYYDNFGRALAGNGQNADAEAALRSAVHLAELQLRSVKDNSSRITWKLNTSETYRDLVRLIFREGDVESALSLWEVYKAAPVRIRQGPEHSSLEPAISPSDEATELRSHLRDLSKETVVTYALLPSELVIWVYDNRGISSHRAEIPASEITADAKRFRELCGNPKSDIKILQDLSRKLYDQLIAPIESYLQSGRDLVVELDEGLSGLPTEALLDSSGRYLGERIRIVSSFGIFYPVNDNANSEITADTSALIVAVPSSRVDLGTFIPPLPDAAAEGDRIAIRFHSASLLTDHSATLQDTLERIPQVGVFHFAGHAFSSSARSGLLLWDAMLTTTALQGVDLSRLQLVVLSACDTQDGSIGSVESSESLVGHFVRAGVPYVVASRWKVDSAASRQFMDLFYAELLHGKSVANAISHTQSQLRSHTNTEHPFYWSAFTVFGES